MNRKTFLLTLLALAGVMWTTDAQAQKLRVFDKEYTADTSVDIGGGTITWDKASATLTLDEVEAYNMYSTFISCENFPLLKIVLVGENSVETEWQILYIKDCNVEISGGGSFKGLKNAGLVVADKNTFVTLGTFTLTAALASLGIILSGALLVLKVRGALFYSILICTVIGIPMGITQIPDAFVPVSLPHSIAPTFLKLDFAALLNVDMILTVFVLVFIDIFNTLGTLIGTAAKTDMMDEKGNVKNIQKAMMADAIATSTGALLGTSTVTTFVESAAGVAEGGRTGLTAFTTAMFFLVALFMAPLFLIIPSAATTGALVLVGVFMLESIKKIDLQDISEALPCFITVLMMVLTYSIAEGMALGLISYTLVKLLSGNYKDVNITLFIVSSLLVLRYVFQ